MLVGHVSSVSEGNGFRNLERVRSGDTVQVRSGERVHDYVVTSVTRSSRPDLSYLAQPEDATVTLLTCVGQWLDDIHDYAERLVVRATLVPPPTPTATPAVTTTPSPTPIGTATRSVTPVPPASNVTPATASVTSTVDGLIRPPGGSSTPTRTAQRP